jgi:hypothetical protein
MKKKNIPIANQGVRKLLDKINPNLDQICGKVLKELSSHISTAITYIFQELLDTGKVPGEWKHGNMMSRL